MEQEIKTGNMIAEVKNVTVCDNCKKTLSGYNNIEIEQNCYCWGNDYVDGNESWDFCSIKCMNSFLKEGLQTELFFDKDYDDGNFKLSIRNLTLNDFNKLYGEQNENTTL
jgi:hypothetical protein